MKFKLMIILLTGLSIFEISCMKPNPMNQSEISKLIIEEPIENENENYISSESTFDKILYVIKKRPTATRYYIFKSIILGGLISISIYASLLFLENKNPEKQKLKYILLSTGVGISAGFAYLTYLLYSKTYETQRYKRANQEYKATRAYLEDLQTKANEERKRRDLEVQNLTEQCEEQERNNRFYKERMKNQKDLTLHKDENA